MSMGTGMVEIRGHDHFLPTGSAGIGGGQSTATRLRVPGDVAIFRGRRDGQRVDTRRGEVGGVRRDVSPVGVPVTVAGVRVFSSVSRSPDEDRSLSTTALFDSSFKCRLG